MESNIFSSYHIENDVLTLIYEPRLLNITLGPSSKQRFIHIIKVSKARRNIYISQSKKQIQPNKLSSEHIKNDVLTLTYETSYSEDYFETKLQEKFDKFD